MQFHQDEAYKIIGEFTTKANSIEFLVNNLLERIIGQYAKILENPEAAHDTIDHIEAQSIRVRVNIIVLFLQMTNGKEGDIQRIIQCLKEFSKHYNKSIRPIRDFIAHNPYLGTSSSITGRIISSRRYQKGLNSLTLDEIKIGSESLIPILKQLSKAGSDIAIYYPDAEIVREITGPTIK